MDLNSGLFLGDDWVHHCETLADSPAVKGFMAEKAVLSAIRKQGFYLPDLHVVIDSHCIFTSGKEAASLKPMANALYIPDVFNYRAIDGLVRFFPTEGNKAIVIALQISSGLRHDDSPAKFFPSCEVWERKCNGLDIEWHFCWISPTKRDVVVHGEQVKQLRKETFRVNPAYREHHISFGDIYASLSFLDIPRRSDR